MIKSVSVHVLCGRWKHDEQKQTKSFHIKNASKFMGERNAVKYYMVFKLNSCHKIPNGSW